MPGGGGGGKLEIQGHPGLLRLQKQPGQPIVWTDGQTDRRLIFNTICSLRWELVSSQCRDEEEAGASVVAGFIPVTLTP